MSSSTPTRSLNTTEGRFYFQADPSTGMVMVHTPAMNLGGWKVERFGSRLNSAWMRAWLEACFHGRVLEVK